MSKLPVWADIISESYPTPIDAPDNPGSFPVSEEEMTGAQKKRREKIVKAMKDKEETFKHSYGPRWKEVMYATATKMAMNEEFEAGFFVRGPEQGGRPASWWVDYLKANGIPAKTGKSPYSNLVAVFVSQKDAKKAGALLFEDTGMAIDKAPAGGPGGFGAGGRSVDSEALTFDVTSEADEDKLKPEPKKSKKSVSQEKSDDKKSADKKSAPSVSYVLYRKSADKGWSPYFRNFKEDDTLESPVYTSKAAAKSAEQMALVTSPDNVYYRVRPVTQDEADRIQTKFNAFHKKIMSEAEGDAPILGAPAAGAAQQDLAIPLRMQAATVIANSLGGTKPGTKVAGTTPEDMVNIAIRTWRNGSHTPEGWAIGAKMLKLADQMGIKWDKSLLSTVSPAIKQKWGLGENVPAPANNVAPQQATTAVPSRPAPSTHPVPSNQTQQSVSSTTSQRPGQPAPTTAPVSQNAARPPVANTVQR